MIRNGRRRMNLKKRRFVWICHCGWRLDGEVASTRELPLLIEEGIRGSKEHLCKPKEKVGFGNGN